MANQTETLVLADGLGSVGEPGRHLLVLSPTVGLSPDTPFHVHLTHVRPSDVVSQPQFIVHIKDPGAPRGAFHVNLGIDAQNRFMFKLCANRVGCQTLTIDRPQMPPPGYTVRASSDGWGAGGRSMSLTVDGESRTELITLRPPDSDALGQLTLGSDIDGGRSFAGEISSFELSKTPI